MRQLEELKNNIYTALRQHLYVHNGEFSSQVDNRIRATADAIGNAIDVYVGQLKLTSGVPTQSGGTTLESPFAGDLV